MFFSNEQRGNDYHSIDTTRVACSTNWGSPHTHTHSACRSTSKATSNGANGGFHLASEREKKREPNFKFTIFIYLLFSLIFLEEFIIRVHEVPKGSKRVRICRRNLDLIFVHEVLNHIITVCHQSHISLAVCARLLAAAPGVRSAQQFVPLLSPGDPP